jgi:hypothetical protein
MNAYNETKNSVLSSTTLKTDLKIIAACLRHLTEPKDLYGAYRLRHVRYALLRSRGLRASMTYTNPRADYPMFKHIKPFQIRHIVGVRGGSQLATF